MILQFKDLYHKLLGDWTFNRNVIDGDLVIQGKASGRAKFEPCEIGNMLEYEELGQIFLTETRNTLSFSRKYKYLFNETNLEIYFADGISNGCLFHRLLFDNENTNLMSNAKHLCINDLYEGHYDFNELSSFSIKYTVTGPKKNYSIVTKYHKK